MIGNDNVVEIAPTFRFQWEETQDRFVILYPEGMVKLSASAGEILKRCNGTSSVGDIITELTSQFPGVDLEADVHRFLEDAHGQGWIRIR